MHKKNTDSFMIKLFSNLRWQSLSLVLRALVSFFSLGFIASVAGAESVGIYGVVWAFVFAAYSAILGLSGQSIIGLERVEQGHLNVCFLISIFLPFLIVGIGYQLIFASNLIQLPLNMLEGFKYGLVIFPLMCLSVVDNSNIQKALNFKLFALVNTCSTILSALISIAITLFWDPLLGLFALTGFIGFLQFLIYRLIGLRVPIGKCSWVNFLEVWTMGKHLAINAVSGMIWINSPQLIFATLFSLEQVGIYVLCRRLIEMIATQISGLINSVIFPSFSSISSELDRIAFIFQKCNFYVCALMMLPLLVLGSSSSDFLLIYAGLEWTSGAKVLGLIILMQMGLNFGQAVFPTFQSLGYFSYPWKWNLTFTCIQITLILFIGYESIENAVCMLALSTVLMPLTVLKLSEKLKFSFVDWFKNVFAITVFGILSLLVSTLIGDSVESASAYIRILVLSMVALIVYVGLVLRFKLHTTYL